MSNNLINQILDSRSLIQFLRFKSESHKALPNTKREFDQINSLELVTSSIQRIQKEYETQYFHLFLELGALLHSLKTSVNDLEEKNAMLNKVIDAINFAKLDVESSIYSNTRKEGNEWIYHYIWLLVLRIITPENRDNSVEDIMKLLEENLKVPELDFHKSFFHSRNMLPNNNEKYYILGRDNELTTIQDFKIIEQNGHVLSLFSEWKKEKNKKQITRLERINPSKEGEFRKLSQEFFTLDLIFKPNSGKIEFKNVDAESLLLIFQTENPISELNIGDFLPKFKKLVKNLITEDFLFFFIYAVTQNIKKDKILNDRLNASFYRRFNEITELPAKENTIKKYVAEKEKISVRIKNTMDPEQLKQIKKKAVEVKTQYYSIQTKKILEVINYI